METQTSYSNNGKFYLQSKTKSFKKKNVTCRCCPENRNELLTIHHVVPRIIGQAFKSNQFLKCPTIVLCRDCHDRYERTADLVKNEYAHDLNVDLNCPKEITNHNPLDAKRQRVAKAANALIAIADNWSSSIGVDNRVNIILDYLEQPYYTHNDLLRLSKYKATGDKKIPNPAYKNLGEAVIEYFTIDQIKRFWINHWHEFEAKRIKEVKIKNQKFEIKIAVAA